MDPDAFQQQQQEQQLQQGQLHARRAGDKIHFCSLCQSPIAIYGRLLPCLHAFCLACASEMPECSTCQAHITRMERVPPQGLYISAITLQSFRSEADMKNHTQKAYGHLKNAIVQSAKQVQQPMPPQAQRQQHGYQ